MTDEQNKRRNDYQKEYNKNMTDEKKTKEKRLFKKIF